MKELGSRPENEEHEALLRSVLSPVRVVHEADPDVLFTTGPSATFVQVFSVENGKPISLRPTFKEGFRATFPLGTFLFPSDIAQYTGGGWENRKELWEGELCVSPQGEQFKRLYNRLNIIGHVLKLDQMTRNTSHRRHADSLFYETAADLASYGANIAIGDSTVEDGEFIKTWQANAYAARRQPPINFEDVDWKHAQGTPKDLPGLYLAGKRIVQEESSNLFTNSMGEYGFMMAHLLSLSKAVNFETFKIECSDYLKHLRGYSEVLKKDEPVYDRDVIRMVWESVGK